MDEETFVDEQQEKINSLLTEYDDHRAAIKDMIADLEKIREKIDILIPDSLDNRYIRFFEEKVKSMTGLFTTLLEMRKEIAKSVKDEIDIRRRIKTEDELIDLEDMLDVRSMAARVEQFKDETKKIQKKRLQVIKDQIIDDEIEIPGLTDEKGRKIQ